MSRLMRLWHLSPSVNLKRACTAIQWGYMSDFRSDPSSTLCVRTAKALARLRRCAVSPEPSLFAYAISTIISWAGSNWNCKYSTLNVWKQKLKRLAICNWSKRDNLTAFFVFVRLSFLLIFYNPYDIWQFFYRNHSRQLVQPENNSLTASIYENLYFLVWMFLKSEALLAFQTFRISSHIYDFYFNFNIMLIGHSVHVIWAKA